MDVGGIIDAGIGHCGAHARRHLIDLRQPAEMLGRKRRGVGAADGERRAFGLSPSARSNTVQCGAMPPSVPPDITRQILRRLLRRKMTLEQQAQRQRSRSRARSR